MRVGLGLSFVVMMLALILLNILFVVQSSHYAFHVHDVYRGLGRGLERFSLGFAERLSVSCEDGVCLIRSLWGGKTVVVRLVVVGSDGHVVSNGTKIVVPAYGNATVRVPLTAEYVWVVTEDGNVFGGRAIVTGAELYPSVSAPVWLHLRSVVPAFLSTLDLGYANLSYVRFGYSDRIEKYGEVVAWGDWLIGGTAMPLRSYRVVMRSWGYPVLVGTAFRLTSAVLRFRQVPAAVVAGSVPSNLIGSVTASVAVLANGTYRVFPVRAVNADLVVASLNVVPKDGEGIVATFGLDGLPLVFVGGKAVFVRGDYFGLPIYVIGDAVVRGVAYGRLLSSGRSYIAFVNSSAIKLVECDYWKVAGEEGSVEVSVPSGTQYVIVGEVEVMFGNSTVGRYMVQFITSGGLRYGGLNASFVGDHLLVRWEPWGVGEMKYRFTYVVVGVPDYGNVRVLGLRGCSGGVCDFGGLRVWGVGG